MKRCPSRRGSRAVAALALASLIVAACGDDDEPGDADDPPAASDAASDDTADVPTTTGATATTAGTATTTAAGASTTSAPSAATTTNSAAADEPEIDPDGELAYSYTAGFNSLDPHKPVGGNDVLWMRPLYDRLITVAAGEGGALEFAPQLATAWEVSDDGLTIEFELRDDVTFQDGTDFDASAVAANFERAMGADSTVKGDFARVERVEVVDPTHVVVHLTEPDPALLWSFAGRTTGMMVSPAAFGTDLGLTPAGSGPFTLVSAQKDADVVYERWDEHWDPEAALVHRLTISTVGDLNVRYNGARSGEYQISRLDVPLAAEAKSLEDDGFFLQTTLSPVSHAILLNTDMAPLDDPRVRRAIYLAIDRQAISDTILSGLYPPMYQVFAPGVVGHDDELDDDPYDPDAARALIEEAGATGATISVVSYTTAPNNSIAEVVQSMLGEIGLEVELNPFSNTEARPKWEEGGHHASVGPIVASDEPSLTLNQSFLADGVPGTPPADLVTMADAARVMPLGSDERAEAYEEISAYLAETPVHVPITQYASFFLCRPEVVGCDQLLDVSKTDFRGVGIAAS